MSLEPPPRQTILDMRSRSPAVQWTVLAAATLVFVSGLELIHFPAAVLLGAMAAAVLVSASGGRTVMPTLPYVFAQGLVGCLIARSIGPGILGEIVRDWPVFLACVFAVILFSASLGGLLARLKVLPGTTAVWGSAPGAATAMVLMAEAFGGDIRLVAFMQYLRVIFVALAASTVAHFWVVPGGAAPQATAWFPPVDWPAFWQTVALATGASFIGFKARLPAGPLLVSLFAGVVLADTGVVAITLPPWLLLGCYVLVGWVIGSRFTRDMVVHAARMLPRIAASTAALIGLCGVLAWLLHLAAGVDPLTAYLATSPGGADSIAIIAASSRVDLPFVMAMQTTRFLVVLLIGPSLARTVARWVDRPPHVDAHG
jgi:membrane AbrB-like protein